jgi:hypothetical protein
MLTCVACGCVSEDGRGWRAYLDRDIPSHGRPEVAVYCPPCSRRAFDPERPPDDYI